MPLPSLPSSVSLSLFILRRLPFGATKHLRPLLSPLTLQAVIKSGTPGLIFTISPFPPSTKNPAETINDFLYSQKYLRSLQYSEYKYPAGLPIRINADGVEAFEAGEGNIVRWEGMEDEEGEEEGACKRGESGRPINILASDKVLGVLKVVHGAAVPTISPIILRTPPGKKQQKKKRKKREEEEEEEEEGDDDGDGIGDVAVVTGVSTLAKVLKHNYNLPDFADAAITVAARFHGISEEDAKEKSWRQLSVKQRKMILSSDRSIDPRTGRKKIDVERERGGKKWGRLREYQESKQKQGVVVVDTETGFGYTKYAAEKLRQKKEQKSDAQRTRQQDDVKVLYLVNSLRAKNAAITGRKYKKKVNRLLFKTGRVGFVLYDGPPNLLQEFRREFLFGGGTMEKMGWCTPVNINSNSNEEGEGEVKSNITFLTTKDTRHYHGALRRLGLLPFANGCVETEVRITGEDMSWYTPDIASLTPPLLPSVLPSSSSTSHLENLENAILRIKGELLIEENDQKARREKRKKGQEQFWRLREESKERSKSFQAYMKARRMTSSVEVGGKRVFGHRDFRVEREERERLERLERGV